MKVKYPLEAYAFAMVIFSQNMQDALITGILILLITTLGLLLDRAVGSRLPNWSRNSCVIIFMVSLTYSVFVIVRTGILGHPTEEAEKILTVFLGILIARHLIVSEKEVDYNRLLLEGSGAFAALLIIGILREFMAEGSIFGNTVADFNGLSFGFSQAVTGFLLAGLALAILNRCFGYKDIKTVSPFVILPVIVMVQPFEIGGLAESLSIVISIAAVLLLWYSIRKYLVFSRLSEECVHLPAELISVGMVYMILSVF